MTTQEEARKKQLESMMKVRRLHQAAGGGSPSYRPARSSAGGGDQGPIMPEKKPAPAPPTFAPFIDPSREGKSDLAKVKLPTGTAAGLLAALKFKNLDKLLPIKPTDEIEVGDILPGIQEALKPIFRPNLVQQEKIEQEGPQGTAAQKAQEALAYQRATPAGLGSALNLAGQWTGVAGAWLGENLGDVGKGIAGTPQGLLNLASLAGQTAESGVGVAEMATGIEFNPAQTIIGGQTITTIAELARRAGAHEVAKFLVGSEGYDPSQRIAAEPGVLVNLVANVVARQRLAGQDTAYTENILKTWLKGGEVITGERDPEQVIARQTELLKMSAQGTTPEAWKAGIYAYDGTEFMTEFRQRLEAGEDPDTVRDDIDSRLTAESFAQDIIGQMVIDPLNGVEMVGGVPKLLGMGTRGERWAAEKVGEFFTKTDEGAGLLRLAQNGGDVRYTGPLERKLRQIPGLGFFVRPLPETIIARRGEEATYVLKNLAQGISPQAPERLVAAGIDQHPVSLAIQAFINHDSDDLVTALVQGRPTAMSSAQVQDMLGLGAKPMTPAQAAKMGLPSGTIDLFRSNAADRARDWFVKTGEEGITDLANKFDEVQKAYSEAMKTKTIKILDEAGKEVVIKGDDAISAAENQLIKWLEDVNKAYTKAAFPDGVIPGMTPAYKKLVGVRKFFSKMQAPFRFFHLGTNYGNPIRNLGSNKTLGMFDGFNMMTPIRGTQEEIARLGLGGPGLARTLGTQTDVAKQYRKGTGGGVRGFLESMKPMNLSQHFEDIDSQRIMVQGFERQFVKDWRLGGSIPIREWSETATTLGNRADEALALIEGAHGPGELQTVIPRLTSAESWRNTAKTALKGTHDTAMVADMDEILQGAVDQADGISKLQDLGQAGRDQLKDFMENGYVMAGTPAAEVLDAVQLATKGLTPKQAADLSNEFTKELLHQDATVTLFDKYTKTAMDQVAGIADDVLRAHGVKVPDGYATFREYMQAQELAFKGSRDTIMSTYRPTQMQAADAIQSQDWDRLRMIGEDWGRENAKRMGEIDFVNPFAGANNRKRAWDSYTVWSNTFWSDYRATHVENMRKLYDDAANAIEAVKGKGRRPPPVPEDLIVKFMPLANYEQRALHANLLAIGRSKGIDTIAELRDVLQKYGVPHANRLWHGDIRDKNWFTNAVKAIMQWSGEEGAAARAAGGVADAADDTEQVAALLNNIGLTMDDIDSTTLNLVDQTAARLSEQETEIQAVIDAMQNAPSAPLIPEEGLSSLKRFLEDLEPRHVMTRNVAEQVANLDRDFALLNYGDNRGIDLISGMFFNYPKWYFGTMKNTVSRALQSPGRLAAMLKFRQKLRQINRDLPEWYQDQISIKTAAGPLYFNILASMDFTNGFFGDKFRDSDLYENPLSAFMAESQQFGPGLHGSLASAMAIRAALSGNMEESMGWMGNLGPATRGITAITAVAKERGGPGLDFIPAGGVVLEPWLWGLEEGQGAQMMGSKFDRRRIGLAMGEMVTNKEITAEEGYDAMLSMRGEVYDKALNRSKVNSAKSVLASWLFGAGIKPHPGIEMEVQRMDADRSALMKARDEGFYEGRPEAWRMAWEQMRETYPFMDFVSGFRRDPIARSNIYAMSVYDRMPPNSRAYVNALMGGDADMYSDLLDKFYGGEPGQKPCDIGNMTQPEQEIFMSMMKMLGAVLSLPEDAVGNEWNMARMARSAMYTRLNQQYSTTGDGTGITSIQDEYYSILNSEQAGAADLARQYLDMHPELSNYWDDKDAMIASDPILAKYWGSMELFERVAKDQFDAKMYVKYPTLQADLDEYYRLKAIDPEAAKTFLKENKVVTDYWAERDQFMIGIDKEMQAMTAGITQLEGEWGTLREGVEAEIPGQQRVMDLIEGGGRPMGSFELPESLTGEQVQAQIQAELDKVTNWGALYSQLGKMGNLDKTLTAYQQWGRGFKNVDNVTANMAELKALLTALSAINEGSAPYSGGKGGRVRSRTYGGASSAPKAQEAANQKAVDERVDAFMGSILANSDLYYGLLRNMADMTSPEIMALLESNPAFRDWVKAACGKLGVSIATLLNYFKRMQAARTTSATKSKSSKKKGSKAVQIRMTQPGL